MKSRSPSLSEDGEPSDSDIRTHVQTYKSKLRWTLEGDLCVCACSLEVSWWSAGIVFVCVCVCGGKIATVRSSLKKAQAQGSRLPW